MKCAICKKELPSDYKVPMCDYHRAKAKETVAGTGAAVVGGVVFIKQGGGKLLVDAGGKALKYGKVFKSFFH